MNKKTQNHFTIEERIELLNCITKGFSIRKTASFLNKAPSTISRELKKHRYFSKGFERDRCKHVRLCRKGPNCHINCPSYELGSCIRIARAPWICNGCENYKHCRKSKFRYDPIQAQKNYLSTLSKSREGIHTSDDELEKLNSLLTHRVKEKRQSLHHLISSDDTNIPVSLSSLYRYIDKGYLEIKNIDLPRRVRYRKGNPKPINKVEKKQRLLRTYQDFIDYTNHNKNASIYEMDTVIGKRERGHKLLLTILLRDYNFMFAFLLSSKNANEVVNVLNDLESKLGKTKFTTLFCIGLTDNGTEFSAIDEIECTHRKLRRTRLFYCDPKQSQQKGKIEKNHEYIRMFVPQGSSFDSFTQDDSNLMMNHINSVKRPQFDGKSPFEMLPRHLLASVKKLGFHPIQDKDVCLSIRLFKK